MVSPHSSSFVDIVGVSQDSGPRRDNGHGSHSRRSSASTFTSEESGHRPGVSQPLPLSDDGRIDLECAESESRETGAMHPLAAGYSAKSAGKTRAIESLSPRTNLAHVSSYSANLSREDASLSLPGGQGSSAVESKWHECATSPLRVDMTTVPPINILPHLSPEGTFSIQDAYQLGYLTPAADGAEDPLLLRSKVVNTEQELRRRGSKGRRTDRRLRNYYDRQNLHIENLLKPISKHASEKDDEMEAASKMVRILIWLNIVSNFALAGLQLYAAISSLSLSLFATAADSVFDPFANIVLNWLHTKSKRLDERKWPIGGSRMENAGNIVYAAIMGAVSVVLIVESARDIGSHKEGETNTLYLPSLIAVGCAFLTKLVLGVFNYMYRKHSSQLDMLWVDCRNDLAINGFGIFTSAAGAKIVWWLDPTGAIIISVGIIISWSLAAHGQFRELCGVAAPVEFLQLCTYNALHIHYNHIDMIDSVKAYHSGPKYIVEVDIVMKPETPLWLSHNVSQDLQDKIEQLPMVERAFVHVDFEVDHRPEHSAAKKVK